ncbi:MAG TPA: diaminopimelate epimerase [Aquaticitalea sp.]|nr:diaminopimelate epimerase [Aquaticitalea sp.]
MNTDFYKYQGTGNDFVIIDNRSGKFDKTNVAHIAHLCNRRFGVGADGLILLEQSNKADFKMVYFNADGNQSTMCGNGGRCIVSFANFLGIINNETRFEAIDGMHHAIIEGNAIKLKMDDVEKIESHEHHLFLNTGSPHHVQLEQDLEILDVKSEGKKIRYGAPYFKEGSNVNFVKKLSCDTFLVRTYERGVEDETLSCGTGVTAVALAMDYIGETEKKLVSLHTLGGQLQVMFEKNKNTYNNIWLIGPAELVFKGSLWQR